MIDITEIVKLLFGLCTLLITGVLFPLIKNKLSTDKQEMIKALVTIAVTAAEQMYKDPGCGQKKKEYVITWLKERGVNLDGDKLDAMIEAAVYELTHLKAIEPHKEG